VQERFGSQDVGTLVHERGGHAHRDLLGQRDRLELEIGERRQTRKPSCEHSKLMSRLREIALERRQRGARLLELCALREHVGARHGAERELALDNGELAFLCRDDLDRRAHLRAQRCVANCRRRDVRGQREMRAFEQVSLVVDQRLKAFDLAPCAAEDVERVGDADVGVVEREQAAAEIRLAQRGAGDFLARHRCLCVDGRIEELSFARGEILVGLAQCGLRRGQRGAVGQRLAYQVIEGRRAEQRPPLRR
jgi:hypothetical protein